ncbi:hypothetical protein SAMN05444371_1830 [Epilithonimonas mollis]|uniref:Uncharacterized protein n=1 Tax=Epilithonimonas mollis TaxID=216903 RepID=A0A1M6RDN6_9FLAO|nr:hypothetical protein SAMN05444371_1830 [Epilithonimonas mollis]
MVTSDEHQCAKFYIKLNLLTLGHEIAAMRIYEK